MRLTLLLPLKVTIGNPYGISGGCQSDAVTFRVHRPAKVTKFRFLGPIIFALKNIPPMPVTCFAVQDMSSGYGTLRLSPS
jgi:hypothetical protein